MRKRIERHAPAAALFVLLVLCVGPAWAGAGASVTTMKQACAQNRAECNASCESLYAEDRNELRKCRAQVCDKRYKACMASPGKK